MQFVDAKCQQNMNLFVYTHETGLWQCIHPLRTAMSLKNDSESSQKCRKQARKESVVYTLRSAPHTVPFCISKTSAAEF